MNEQASLARKLAVERCGGMNAVVIYGPAGCGKTRNALTLALANDCSRIGDDFTVESGVLVAGGLHLMTRTAPIGEDHSFVARENGDVLTSWVPFKVAMKELRLKQERALFKEERADDLAKRLKDRFEKQFDDRQRELDESRRCFFDQLEKARHAPAFTKGANRIRLLTALLQVWDVQA